VCYVCNWEPMKHPIVACGRKRWRCMSLYSSIMITLLLHRHNMEGSAWLWNQHATCQKIFPLVWGSVASYWLPALNHVKGGALRSYCCWSKDVNRTCQPPTCWLNKPRVLSLELDPSASARYIKHSVISLQLTRLYFPDNRFGFIAQRQSAISPFQPSTALRYEGPPIAFYRSSTG